MDKRRTFKLALGKEIFMVWTLYPLTTSQVWRVFCGVMNQTVLSRFTLTSHVKLRKLFNKFIQCIVRDQIKYRIVHDIHVLYKVYYLVQTFLFRIRAFINYLNKNI